MDYCSIGHADLEGIELWAWIGGRMQFVDATDFPAGHCEWPVTSNDEYSWSGRIDHIQQVLSIAGYPRSASQTKLFDIAADKLAERHPDYTIWGRRSAFGDLELIG